MKPTASPMPATAPLLGLADRREFLRRVFFTAGALSAGGLLAACGNSPDIGSAAPSPALPPTTPPPTSPTPPPGPRSAALPLTPGPLSNIGPLVDSGLDGLMIPEGFAVRAVARHYSNPVTGLVDPLGATGYVWHAAPDGGAVFPASDGGWVYVSNSETGIGGAVFGSSRDGGVGALRFAADGTIRDAYRILDGTRGNCAGGATPWNTWLSCEETGDGLVYQCDPFGTPATATAHPALGIFNHEAASIDLATRTVFLTEDAGDGRLYRFKADASDVVTENGVTRLKMQSGKLQVLEVEGFGSGGYIETDEATRAVRKVSWVDVVSPDRQQSVVRGELAAAGMAVPGTVFRGGEGIWNYMVPPTLTATPEAGTVPTRAVVFFACKGDNRVYALDVDNDLLQGVFDNASIDPAFDDVDNVVVSPAGDVLVAEDGEAMRLMVVFPNTPAKVLLQCTLGGSEITGPAFTPDGSRLYFSSQRGPNAAGGFLPSGTGVTYELLIPAAFRAAPTA